MEWTDEDRKALIDFTESIDSDDIHIKEQIKKVLLNNRFIIHAIKNKELEDAEASPDEYFGENILPYYIIPDTQHNNQTYICYEVGYDQATSGWPHSSARSYPYTSKLLRITFYVLCDHTDKDWCIDSETGVARHDLIAALLIDQFNFTTKVGGAKIRLMSDQPSTTDSSYSSRTLIFEQITDNNLVKTHNGSTKFENKIQSPSQFEGIDE